MVGGGWWLRLGRGWYLGTPREDVYAAERRENTKEQASLAFWRVMADFLYPLLKRGVAIAFASCGAPGKGPAQCLVPCKHRVMLGIALTGTC